MPASFTWQPGPNGGTPTNAANLNRLALTADMGTAGTPTGDAGRAAYDARLTVAATATGNTTAAADTYLPVNATSGAVTVTLPTGQAKGATIVVEKEDASANAVTLSGSLRGAAGTVNLVWQYESVTVVADASGSWWPRAGHKTKAAMDAAYVAPSAIAVGPGIDPTGAADSTAALQAKINALPIGGTLYLPVGTYKLTAALTIAQSCRIVGESVAGNWPGLGAGGTFDSPHGTPPLLGTVLNQTGAGVDGITITASGSPVHLENLGILFTGATVQWKNTGHGINASPTATVTNGHGTGHDHGVLSSTWRNIIVFGHDGNHYGFKLLNTMYCTLEQIRAYGGGVLEVLCDSVSGNYGNLVVIHPYGNLICAGTAHGYHLKGAANSGSGYGVLNLITMIRPQCNGESATNTYPATTPPTNAQYLFRAGEGFAVDRLSIIGPDLESPLGMPVSLGGGAHFVDVAGTPALAGVPTMTAGSALTASPGYIMATPPFPSSDNAGSVDITAGTSSVAAFADVVVVTYAIRNTTSFVTLSAATAGAAQAAAYVTNSTPTGFTIRVTNPLSANQRYIWNYSVSTGNVLNT